MPPPHHPPTVTEEIIHQEVKQAESMACNWTKPQGFQLKSQHDPVYTATFFNREADLKHPPGSNVWANVNMHHKHNCKTENSPQTSLLSRNFTHTGFHQKISTKMHSELTNINTREVLITLWVREGSKQIRRSSEVLQSSSPWLLFTY